MPTTTHQELADRWIEGLRGDWSTLEELCAPTMRVWHSFDNTWLDREQSSARMDAVDGALPELHDVRMQITEHGFVVQAYIETGGARTHIVQLLTVADGQVAACEEYVAPERP